jgi:hypothetical protein
MPVLVLSIVTLDFLKIIWYVYLPLFPEKLNMLFAFIPKPTKAWL